MSVGSQDHRTGKGSGVELVTFGCRLNNYASDAIAQYADAAGLCDTIDVNTCAVTTEA
ncbi:MAG TPA: tRNA (N(6)-L-threonylcarbamoyladenosine(37)-C(2))-methylthiotransferase MtaB, partial [Saliniramus sp.]|nr:tRNA (N(6)-L-threonylcarbamoyladenosine(37)-C(2))-methylthiotransferase MtaB [Saliniramus sp.]